MRCGRKLLFARHRPWFWVSPQHASLCQSTFDTETDLQALAAELKGTEKDGICSWGEEHKLVEIAFGVKKLRIQMIVEDEKLCQDDLEDHINDNGRDDKIQSVDVFTMSKL